VIAGIFGLSSSDLKTVTLTIIATVCASGIIYLVAKLFSRKAKLLWTHEASLIEFCIPDSYFNLRALVVDKKLAHAAIKDRNITVRWHKITVENVGRIDAEIIKLVLPMTDAKVECKLLERSTTLSGWILSSSSAPNYVQRQQDSETIIELRQFKSRQIAEFRYPAIDWSSLDPKGVVLEGGIVEKAVYQIWFFKKRYFLMSLFQGNPIYVFAILAILLSATQLLNDLLDYFWKQS
jgi:hypothetical protein